jgi:LacI family transcriptional regulator
MAPKEPIPRATIREVAAAAGVSMGTVSRVAAGTGRISETTRAKVITAMRELAYEPNAAARAMRTKVTKTVGLLIPDITCPIFIRVATGAEEVLGGRGYMLFSFSSNRQTEREFDFLRAARQRQMDGVIVSVSDEGCSKTVGELRTMGIPLVILDREIPVDADVIYNEHFDAMETLLTHLIALGHRRIGLICSPTRIRPGRERVRAYRHAMTKAGLDIDDTLIRATGQGHDYGAAEAYDLLTADDRAPTALIAAGSDTFAGALATIRSLNLDIPGDISFVGADESEMAEIAGPPITMIERDMREVGRNAARMLLERFDGLSLPPRKMMLASKVVLRKSVAPFVGSPKRAHLANMISTK